MFCLLLRLRVSRFSERPESWPGAFDSYIGSLGSTKAREVCLPCGEVSVSSGYKGAFSVGTVCLEKLKKAFAAQNFVFDQMRRSWQDIQSMGEKGLDYESVPTLTAHRVAEVSARLDAIRSGSPDVVSSPRLWEEIECELERESAALGVERLQVAGELAKRSLEEDSEEENEEEDSEEETSGEETSGEETSGEENSGEEKAQSLRRSPRIAQRPKEIPRRSPRPAQTQPRRTRAKEAPRSDHRQRTKIHQTHAMETLYKLKMTRVTSTVTMGQLVVRHEQEDLVVESTVSDDFSRNACDLPHAGMIQASWTRQKTPFTAKKTVSGTVAVVCCVHSVVPFSVFLQDREEQRKRRDEELPPAKRRPTTPMGEERPQSPVYRSTGQ